MEHPFNTKMELNNLSTEQVAAGSLAIQLPKDAKLPSRSPIKPPMETTMAIGEEGGSFGNWF
ncbi:MULTISPECIES: hypothetical protein [Alteromonadaceae]|uniref:hypothetical protein n=1 Tax=Alteromonadaceae TaxID=72275 RepID=UPI001C0841CE|nr:MULTISPECIES: hypothetical protein [Aliiglaciecola]MBU2877648.1 hypothetical protein [Aliiglaciecola lipolytica]MDO6713181.1 hypothetical protein [Aliiglaciecola sp. 2_MG-2023]MDO6754261.1 hypothetical protein [Aliiglaciecola sp. 1_MG-2023]